VVSVDPRISSTGSPTNFVGITGLRFTAATAANETVSDSVNVIVDTPPAFDEDAIADTVRFEEDTQDTSLVLVAVDPDPGAQLTFSSVDTGAAVNTPAAFDASGRVTFLPRANFSGTETRRFRVADQFGLADTVSVVVEVTPVNDPPEFYNPFPDIEIGALGQRLLNLSAYLRDVDDPFEMLELTFTGVDSIAFEPTALNAELRITAVPPFVGTRTATIVAKDTSEAAGITTIRVTVLTPENPQPPVITVPAIKVGVRAGEDTSVALDDYVSDIDTPKNRLIWRAGAVDLVSIDPLGLTQRLLTVSAEPDSVGMAVTSATVTDPTALFDSAPVRIYSASPVTGIPVTGGLPDLTIPVGEADSLDLDDYYFDATNVDDDMIWTFAGNIDVAVELDRLTRRTVLRAPAETDGLSEEIVFTVTDPDGNSASDTMRVTVLEEGAILVDPGLLVAGGVLTLPLGTTDTLDLGTSLRVGDPDSVSWTAVSRDPVATLLLDEAAGTLEVTGARVGNTFVVLTAAGSQSTSTDSLRVAVTTTSAGLQVVETFELVLQAERDTILNLNTLVVSGNSPNLLWSTPGNPDVGVEVDQTTQLATLRPRAGFVGDAGAIQFQVTNPVTAEVAVSTATPVTVEGGGAPGTRGLLRISVVANPVLPNFLDVFVISQRDLFGDPFLRTQIGEGPDTKPRSVQVDSVEEVTNVWVGDLALSDEVTGRVQLTATGITQATQIALTDTMVLQVESAGVQSAFAISNGPASVRLPQGALSKPAVVALVPRRTDPSSGARKATGDGQHLTQIGDTYLVHATRTEIRKAGRITLGHPVAEALADRAGVYRWAPEEGRWRLVGGETGSGGVSGAFTALGTYGLFADPVAPRVSDPVYRQETGHVVFPVEDSGSGVDAASVTLVVNGEEAAAAYFEPMGGIRVERQSLPEDGFADVRISIADLAGNAAAWDSRIDLSRLIPTPAKLVLHQNHPNPFNPSTVVRFELPGASAVRLVIYNLLGQEVRRLAEGRMPAGVYTVHWDATDDRGRAVAAGPYLYVLRTEVGSRVRKMLLLK
jgi:hypothetical protein